MIKLISTNFIVRRIATGDVQFTVFALLESRRVSQSLLEASESEAQCELKASDSVAPRVWSLARRPVTSEQSHTAKVTESVLHDPLFITMENHYGTFHWRAFSRMIGNSPKSSLAGELQRFLENAKGSKRLKKVQKRFWMVPNIAQLVLLKVIRATALLSWLPRHKGSSVRFYRGIVAQKNLRKLLKWLINGVFTHKLAWHKRLFTPALN